MMLVADKLIIEVLPKPIKTAGAPAVDYALLEAQAQKAAETLVPVDYTKVPGTCIDERKRIGLRSGEAEVQPRPSVLGGPLVYGFVVGLLSGVTFKGTTAQEQIKDVKDRLVAANLLPGAHEECAALRALVIWLASIAQHPDGGFAYAKINLGESYAQSTADQVVANAQAVIGSGILTQWSEDIVFSALGNDADEGIEKLAHVDHEGVLVIRNKRSGYTLNQNALYNTSVLGKGCFDFDDAYADLIEAAMIGSGTDSARHYTMATHARELMIAAVAGAVPNEELYQATIFER